MPADLLATSAAFTEAVRSSASSPGRPNALIRIPAIGTTAISVKTRSSAGGMRPAYVGAEFTAVVQIIGLSLLAVIGMTVRQLPTFAFRSAGDYADAMADIHARYDSVLGRGLVDAMERLCVEADQPERAADTLREILKDT